VDNTLTMILAGGRCKRMEIFCRHKAKSAISFAGNSRVIDFTLSNCVHSENKNIAVLADYHRISMAIYLNRWVAANCNSRTFHVLEPKYGTYVGNADAVYQNIDFLKKNSSDLILIVAGDMIYRMDYRKILLHHRESGADVTISTTRVPIEQASRFGVVNLDNNSRVTSFLEKPEIPQSNIASMSIYVFNKQLLIENLIEDAAIASSPHDFGHAILPRMVRQNNVSAYSFSGYWRDIGTPQGYYEANMEVLPEASTFLNNDAWPLLTEPDRLEDPRITLQGNVQNSIISHGCVVKGQVLNSVLAPGVWVEEEAVVRDSVVMGNSFIGYHSVVDHCVLSEGVNIGRLCYLGFGGSVSPGEGVTVLGDQVTVPPHTAIGRNCKILPHTSLSDFTRKVIPSESVIAPLPAHKSFGADNLSKDYNKNQNAFRPAD
jgi:glucose-1-phosphate adenylyltransferase